MLGSIPIVHFFLMIIVKGNEKSSTIALHAVMCVFGICIQNDLEYTHTESAEALALIIFPICCCAFETALTAPDSLSKFHVWLGEQSTLLKESHFNFQMRTTMPQICFQLLHGNNAEVRAPLSTALSHKWYKRGKSCRGLLP